MGRLEHAIPELFFHFVFGQTGLQRFAEGDVVDFALIEGFAVFTGELAFIGGQFSNRLMFFSGGFDGGGWSWSGSRSDGRLWGVSLLREAAGSTKANNAGQNNSGGSDKNIS